MKRGSSFVRTRLGILAAGMFMTAVAAPSAWAQGGVPLWPKPRWPGDAIHVTPDVIMVDPATRTATLTITSLVDDIIDGNITVQHTTPGALPDSIRRNALAPSWITDVPRHFVIVPAKAKTEGVTIRGAAVHTQTVTLHLAVPASLKPGTYTTSIVIRKPRQWLMYFNKKGTVEVGAVTAGNTAVLISDEQTVVRPLIYHVGASH